MVTVLGKGQVKMKELQAHDKVYTGTKLSEPFYQEVYSFVHWQDHISMEYIQVYYSKAYGTPLELSPSHLIFSGSKETVPIPASMIQAGDALLLDKDGIQEEVTVTKVKIVTKEGAYLPLTSDGTIVVNDVVASAYVSIHDSAPKIVDWFGGIGIAEQTLFHWWLAPYRMVCTGMAPQLCTDDYNEEGIIHWLAFGEKLAVLGEKMPALVQWIGLTLVLALLGFLVVAEAVRVKPMTICLMVASLVAWDRMKKSLPGKK